MWSLHKSKTSDCTGLCRKVYCQRQFFKRINWSNLCNICLPLRRGNLVSVVIFMWWIGYSSVLNLTLSWRRPLSYRNQSIDLLRKSMDWFLHDNGPRHERVKTGTTASRFKWPKVKKLFTLRNCLPTENVFLKNVNTLAIIFVQVRWVKLNPQGRLYHIKVHQALVRRFYFCHFTVHLKLMKAIAITL